MLLLGADVPTDYPRERAAFLDELEREYELVYITDPSGLVHLYAQRDAAG